MKFFSVHPSHFRWTAYAEDLFEYKRTCTPIQFPQYSDTVALRYSSLRYIFPRYSADSRSTEGIFSALVLAELSHGTKEKSVTWVLFYFWKRLCIQCEWTVRAMGIRISFRLYHRHRHYHQIVRPFPRFRKARLGTRLYVGACSGNTAFSSSLPRFSTPGQSGLEPHAFTASLIVATFDRFAF